MQVNDRNKLQWHKNETNKKGKPNIENNSVLRKSNLVYMILSQEFDFAERTLAYSN